MLHDALDQSYWHEVRSPSLPWPVWLLLRKGPDDRLVCGGIIITPVGDLPFEIQARDLRKVRIGEILSVIAPKLAKDPVFLQAQDWILPPFEKLRVRRGPKGPTDDELKKFAVAYQHALLEAPRRPIQHLKERGEGSEATIRRNVARARARGFLPEKKRSRKPKIRKVTKDRRRGK